MGRMTWVDIFKALPKRQPKGDPRNIERVLAFTKLCNEAKKRGDDMEGIFKKCGFCGKEWRDLFELAEDRDAFYRGVTEYEGKVVFFFDHTTCKSTLGITSADVDKWLKLNNEIYNKSPMT